MRARTETLIKAYYDRFNAQDVDGFLGLLSDTVVHEVSQGGTEKGKAAFRTFIGHMNACYREKVKNLAVMTSSDGRRAAAEFDLTGTYLKTDGKLPKATGQRYTLRVGAFFEVRRGKVARISNHYNMKDWLRQIGQSSTAMALRIVRLRGSEILARQDDLARLRIEVFRDFPYLYEGSREYEAAYIRTYVEARDSVLIAAIDGDRIVGASTALPMAEAMEECIQPFAENGYDIARIFYFGESVLLKPYRGQGVGVRFFAEREAAALAHPQVEITAFCAVERPTDHRLRPPDYVPLDAFWTRRGYMKHRELVARFHWRDLGEREELTKPLSFWLKRHERQPQP